MDETHGGGLYMSDNDWLRILNNKGFYTGGEIRGGKIRADGDVSAGGILTLDKINVAGTACPVNGAISRDTAGATLSCQSGLWNLGVKTLERKTWSMASGSDYGDICTSYLVSSNLIKQGWIVTGSDACTEDTRDCTVDNVRCFAVRLK